MIYYVEYCPESDHTQKLWCKIIAETEDEARFLAEPLIANELQRLNYPNDYGLVLKIKELI